MSDTASRTEAQAQDPQEEPRTPEGEGPSAEGQAPAADEHPAETPHPEDDRTEHDRLVEELEDQVQEARDKHLRLLAEFENFRRRTAKESVTLRQTAARDLIADLLPVLDDFDRALKAMDGNPEHRVDAEGFRLIAEKFRGVLKRRDLEPMEALGEPFDPEMHEAITEVPAPDPDRVGKVIDVIEPGYRLGEVIIRHAKVVVGK
jgi:molecular chaperone GrpE